jgi:hypothetical protein
LPFFAFCEGASERDEIIVDGIIIGKIGDSYSLEVRVIAHVHTVLLNFHRPSPKKGIFLTTHYFYFRLLT